MQEPLNVLDLAPGASDGEIRRRYLELVRANPPERAPERFAEVRAAYEALSDPVQRLKRQLFELPGDDSIDDIAASVRRHQRTRHATDLLLSLGR